MSIVPWETDQRGQKAVKVETDLSGYISPAKSKNIILGEVSKVATISAEFNDEVIVYDPLFWCSKSGASGIEFIGLYLSSFELEDDDLPDMCIRKCSWQPSFGDLEKIYSALSCKSFFVCSKNCPDIESVVSMLKTTSIRDISSLLEVDRDGSEGDSIEFYMLSETATINTSYFADSCKNDLVEKTFQRLMDFCRTVSGRESFIPNKSSFRVSYG